MTTVEICPSPNRCGDSLRWRRVLGHIHLWELPSVALAAVAAKAKGMKVLGMTGSGGGKLGDLSDVCIQAPSDETFEVQEFHVAVYHFLCAALEARFFEE